MISYTPPMNNYVLDVYDNNDDNNDVSDDLSDIVVHKDTGFCYDCCMRPISRLILPMMFFIIVVFLMIFISEKWNNS